MVSLTERLKALGVNLGTAGLNDQPGRISYPIERVIEGEIRDTQFGQTFVVRTIYPFNRKQGHVDLAFPKSLQRLSVWAGNPDLMKFSPGSFLFIDTETSGLSGGTGTLVFLIGMGRFTDEGFALTQFFLREPSEEPAYLQALLAEIDDIQVLVTYNGRAFDVPLINNRLALNNEKKLFGNVIHLDLLMLARKIWRDSLPSRSLGRIETDILGVSRTEEDIPGWMIPEMYYNYLKTGDARPLRSVFYHNAMDILSLAALLNRTALLLEVPEMSVADKPIELIAIGKLFEEMGFLDEAVSCYATGLNCALPEKIRIMTLMRWSYLEKRRENLRVAIELWKQAAREKDLAAHIEMAKYCEHRLGDYQEAITWAEGAISLIDSEVFSAFEREYWRSAIEHRLARLYRKAGVDRGEL